MTIAEMHVWFRQYATQMGMQNVRAILPEQIDTLINTATVDTVDEVVNRNVGTTNDRIITDNAKLSNINALRTLYKVKTYTVPNGGTVNSYKDTPLVLQTDTILGDAKALYLVDFSIRYTNDSVSPATTTRLFPIRIIDDAYLADVLNDWVLSPRMRTPVMVVYAKEGSVEASTLEIYLGENDATGIANLANTLKVKDIRMSYIKKPNQVKYLTDIGGVNVDSDLPEQLQIPMLKHAVDLYRVSIQGSLYANQQNAQQNQQELVRNNARPDNDGYQS